MPSERRPFRLNVGFIVHEDIGYTRDFPFEAEHVRLGDDLELRHLVGVATIGRTPQGLVVQSQFAGEVQLECVRCLREFWHRLEWGFAELYAFTRKSVSDSGLLMPEDGHIDLESLLCEYSLLDIPINPLHAADCKGLCPVCGQDLNVRDCGHRRETGESPFSVLKGRGE